jgi:hypothetical protein
VNFTIIIFLNVHEEFFLFFLEIDILDSRAFLFWQRISSELLLDELGVQDLVAEHGRLHLSLKRRRRELAAHHRAVGLAVHQRVLRVELVHTGQARRSGAQPEPARVRVGRRDVLRVGEEALVLLSVVLRQLHEALLEQLRAVALEHAALLPRGLELVARRLAEHHGAHGAHALDEGQHAVGAVVAEEDRDRVELERVARERHGAALVRAVGAEGIEHVPEERVVEGAKVDGRHGVAGLAAFKILNVLSHCGFFFPVFFLFFYWEKRHFFLLKKAKFFFLRD